ncbi:MAG: hypothetical protein ABJL54_03455 [Halioglobus sp.]
MNERQSSQLLPDLFESVAEDQCITVLHLGPVLPETMEYFSSFRCKLHVNDLFAELPLSFKPGDELTVQERMSSLVSFPEDTRFDVCLFWDLLNYLDQDGVVALMQCLRPHLATTAMAHAFTVHNIRSPQRDCRFGIVSDSEIVLRPRHHKVPEYAPHSQGKLKEWLDGFDVKRSVLLAQSRLEILLELRV